MSEKPDIEEEKKPTEGKSFSSSTNLCCSHKITYLGFHSMLFVHTHIQLYHSDDYCGPFTYLWHFHAKFFSVVCTTFFFIPLNMLENIFVVEHREKPTIAMKEEKFVIVKVKCVLMFEGNRFVNGKR